MKFPIRFLLAVGGAAFLAACGDGGPIAQTADASAPVVPTAPNAGDIYGKWAADPAWCNDAGGKGSPILIDDGRFVGLENECAMTKPEVNGEGWLVTLQCQGEGQTSTERLRFIPKGDQLLITYIDRGVDDVQMTRCP